MGAEGARSSVDRILGGYLGNDFDEAEADWLELDEVRAHNFQSMRLPPREKGGITRG